MPVVFFARQGSVLIGSFRPHRFCFVQRPLEPQSLACVQACVQWLPRFLYEPQTLPSLQSESALHAPRKDPNAGSLALWSTGEAVAFVAASAGVV